MSLEMRIETITPEKAAQWLSLNKTNRPLSGYHVSKLARAMSNDEWQVNGETIKFNESGLVDGQHRLNAIIRSNKTIKSYVVRGVGCGTYDTIDQGKSRSLGDVLAREGKKSYNTLSGASKWLRCLVEDTSYGSTMSYTNHQMVTFIKERPDLETSVEFVRQYATLFRGLARCWPASTVT